MTAVARVCLGNAALREGARSNVGEDDALLKILPRTTAPSRVNAYFAELNRVCASAHVHDLIGRPMELEAGFDWFARRAVAADALGNTLIFIGNGGSASIASHQAIDYLKNGDIRATALNDSAALTCLSNDCGYPEVFAKQIEKHGREGDMLVAISSSGQSENILRGVKAARAHKMTVATFSGFSPDNSLRTLGDVNFYVESDQYGYVELAHLTLIHAILDLDVIAKRRAA
jgi:D-sedoheptulose 7-phosphate isomerase